MSERQGIEIDYCPNCRGVWLDRGELDKMIERSVSGSSVSSGSSGQSGQRYENERDRHDRDERHEHSRDYKPYKKKREGFLSDLFDFD